MYNLTMVDKITIWIIGSLIVLMPIFILCVCVVASKAEKMDEQMRSSK